MKHLLTLITIIALGLPAVAQEAPKVAPKEKPTEIQDYICKVSGQNAGVLPIPEFHRLAKLEITPTAKSTKDSITNLSYQVTFVPKNGEAEYFVLTSFTLPEHVILKIMTAEPGDVMTIFEISFQDGKNRVKLPASLIYTAL